MSTVDIEEQCDACGERFPITHMRSWVTEDVRRYVCLNTIECRQRVGRSSVDPAGMAGRVRGMLDIAREWPSDVGYKRTFIRELERLDMALRMMPPHSQGIPSYAYAILDAFINSKPLDFGGEPVPSTVRVLLDAAVASGQLVQVHPDIYAAPPDLDYASTDWVDELSTQVEELTVRVSASEKAIEKIRSERV